MGGEGWYGWGPVWTLKSQNKAWLIYCGRDQLNVLVVFFHRWCKFKLDFFFFKTRICYVKKERGESKGRKGRGNIWKGQSAERMVLLPLLHQSSCLSFYHSQYLWEILDFSSEATSLLQNSHFQVPQTTINPTRIMFPMPATSFLSSLPVLGVHGSPSPCCSEIGFKCNSST